MRTYTAFICCLIQPLESLLISHQRFRVRMVFIGAFLVVLLLTLTACSKPELYTNLTEHQANEMVALLQTGGIEAKKESRDAGTYAITTQQENFGRAIDMLHANGLPKGTFDTVGQVFKKEGFVSSPTEERARLTYALSQELANTLQTIDGVVVARVHLAVPEKDPLSDKPKAASASVFIKYRAGRDLSSQVGNIKALVINGIEGLTYDNVAVTLFPAETVAPLRVNAAAQSAAAGMNPPLLIAAGVGTALLVLGGLMLWLRRRAVQPSGNNALALFDDGAKDAHGPRT
jgi:type III secretion protein J